MDEKNRYSLTPTPFLMMAQLHSAWRFQCDRKYVTLSQSKAGSDWTELYVREIATNTQLDDKIEWSKFGGAAWYGDGFFYSRFDEPGKNQTYTGASDKQKCITTNWVPNNRQMNWCTATRRIRKDISSAVPQMMNISCSYI